MKIPSLIENSVTCGEVRPGRCLPNVSSWLSVSFLPSHGWPMTIWYAGRAIYCILSAEEHSSVHSVAVTLSCDTLVLTVSSSATLSPFFFLSWERVSWTFLSIPLCRQTSFYMFCYTFDKSKWHTTNKHTFLGFLRGCLDSLFFSLI